MTSYGIQFRLPIHEADGITIAVILCRSNGHHFGLFLTRDGEGKDPKRPRYFTGCVYSESHTRPATYAARMVDLGDDIYKLTFNGKRVEATWRTIYVVPTPSDLDYGDRTTPSLMLNCNPASRFHIPRWLIARLTNLQFEISQVRDTEALQVIVILHRLNGDTSIFVSLGLCSANCGSDNRPHLWAKVDVMFLTTVSTFTHDCSKDHLESESWVARSKDFGEAERRVRLSLIPSTRMSESVLEVHLELFGRVFENIIRDAGVSFPSLADIERGAPRAIGAPTPTDPAASSQPPSPSQTESVASALSS